MYGSMTGYKIMHFYPANPTTGCHMFNKRVMYAAVTYKQLFYKLRKYELMTYEYTCYIGCC